MKKFIFIVLITATNIANGQNVIYDANTETRAVEKFSSIEVSGTVSLYLSQGTEIGLAVSAEDAKYNAKIKTEVKQGVLHISVDGGMWNGFSWTNKKLKAYVSVIGLKRLSVSGASVATVLDRIQSDELIIAVSGASEVKGALEAKNLDVDISGASVVKFTGHADNAKINASGAAKVNCFDLHVEKANFDISGASHITISVNKELSANASGGSTIHYRGDAMAKTINANGGATIQKKSSN